MCQCRGYSLAKSRKLSIDMKSLDIGDEKTEKIKQEKTSEEQDGYQESKEPVACTSSDEFKAEWQIHKESSPYTENDHYFITFP